MICKLTENKRNEISGLVGSVCPSQLSENKDKEFGIFISTLNRIKAPDASFPCFVYVKRSL